MFKVMWPWRARSGVKVTVLIYMYLSLFIPKTWKTKLVALASLESEKQKVMFVVKQGSNWRGGGGGVGGLNPPHLNLPNPLF